MNPFIPLKKARFVLVAGNADQEIINSLDSLGLEVIPTIRCQEVYDSIAYHPDIVIHPINHNTLIIAPNVFDYYKERLGKFNLKIIKGESPLTSKYPGNIAYNVGRLSKAAIHNFKYTDPVLKYYLEKEDLELINVKQGYSKCSMAIIGQDKIITADQAIYKKLSHLAYDCLLIQPGHIELEGQDYGFIGGSSGNLSKDLVVFAGSLDLHPDKEKIRKFIKENKKEVKFLSNKALKDLGTIISF